MQRFQANIVINQPVEAVFAHLTSPEYLAAQYAPFRSEQTTIELDDSGSHVTHRATSIPPLRQMTPGQLGVGTIFRQSNGSPHRPEEATIEVIEYEPPSVFALKQTSRLMRGAIRCLLAPVADGTSLTEMIEIEVEGAFAAFFTLFASNADQKLQEDLQTLKQELEGQSQPQ